MASTAREFSFDVGPLGIALQETSTGLRVLSCARGSPAAEMNVPVGCRVLSISGFSVEGLSKHEVIGIIGHVARPLKLRVAVDPPSFAATELKRTLPLTNSSQAVPPLPPVGMVAGSITVYAYPISARVYARKASGLEGFGVVKDYDPRRRMYTVALGTARAGSTDGHEVGLFRESDVRPVDAASAAVPILVSAEELAPPLSPTPPSPAARPGMPPQPMAQVEPSADDLKVHKPLEAGVRDALLSANVTRAEVALAAARADVEAAKGGLSPSKEPASMETPQKAVETSRGGARDDKAGAEVKVSSLSASPTPQEVLEAAALVNAAARRQEAVTKEVAEAVQLATEMVERVSPTKPRPPPKRGATSSSSGPSHSMDPSRPVRTLDTRQPIDYDFGSSKGPYGIALEAASDGGLVVFRVLPDSAASACGVQAGSELIAVSGRSVRGMSKNEAGRAIVAATRPLILTMLVMPDMISPPVFVSAAASPTTPAPGPSGPPGPPSGSSPSSVKGRSIDGFTAEDASENTNHGSPKKDAASKSPEKAALDEQKAQAAARAAEALRETAEAARIKSPEEQKALDSARAAEMLRIEAEAIAKAAMTKSPEKAAREQQKALVAARAAEASRAEAEAAEKAARSKSHEDTGSSSALTSSLSIGPETNMAIGPLPIGPPHVKASPGSKSLEPAPSEHGVSNDKDIAVGTSDEEMANSSSADEQVSGTSLQGRGTQLVGTHADSTSGAVYAEAPRCGSKAHALAVAVMARSAPPHDLYATWTPYNDWQRVSSMNSPWRYFDTATTSIIAATLALADAVGATRLAIESNLSMANSSLLAMSHKVDEWKTQLAIRMDTFKTHLETLIDVLKMATGRSSVWLNASQEKAAIWIKVCNTQFPIWVNYLREVGQATARWYNGQPLEKYVDGQCALEYDFGDTEGPYGLGFLEESSPLIVTNVVPNSLASQRNVQPGSELLAVGGRSVRSLTKDQILQLIATIPRPLILTFAPPDARKMVSLKVNVLSEEDRSEQALLQIHIGVRLLGAVEETAILPASMKARELPHMPGWMSDPDGGFIKMVPGILLPGEDSHVHVSGGGEIASGAAPPPPPSSIEPHLADDLDESALESQEERVRRLEWIKHYVKVGDSENALELGWDGQPFGIPDQLPSPNQVKRVDGVEGQTDMTEEGSSNEAATEEADPLETHDDTEQAARGRAVAECSEVRLDEARIIQGEELPDMPGWTNDPDGTGFIKIPSHSTLPRLLGAHGGQDSFAALPRGNPLQAPRGGTAERVIGGADDEEPLHLPAIVAAVSAAAAFAYESASQAAQFAYDSTSDLASAWSGVQSQGSDEPPLLATPLNSSETAISGLSTTSKDRSTAAAAPAPTSLPAEGEALSPEARAKSPPRPAVVPPLLLRNDWQKATTIQPARTLSGTRPMGLRGESLPPTPSSGLFEKPTSSQRARRTSRDEPLDSSARRRAKGGASWLEYVKLRHATPRDHSRRRELFRSKPIAAGTPRDAFGESLNSGRLIDYYNEREYASELTRNEVLRPGEEDVDPMPLVLVKRGEASWK
jgi:C-terminal processing protease CtpA/Prc